MLPDIVLFAGRDNTRTASLWETDGTQAGTVVVSNNASPPPYIANEPNFGFIPVTTVSLDLTVFDDQVLFVGRYAPTPANQGPYTIWTTDGTANGTVPLIIAGANSKGLFSGAAIADTPLDPGFTVFGDEVLFRGVDTVGAAGLWVTDGTATGTTEITAGAASAGISPTDITVYGSVALFNGVNAAGHQGLWTTDGTSGGTMELASIRGAAATGLNPTDLTVFNHEVLFNGMDAAGHLGLWTTIGKAGGTQEITSIVGANAAGLDPTDLTVFGSEVLFSGLDANGLNGLWITDGTATGTRELLAEAAGATADPLGLNPSEFIVFNGKVFFNGLDGGGLPQLWETDGTTTGTQMLSPASANSVGLNPMNFVVYDGKLLFEGQGKRNFFGLFTSDGTAAGTQEITPVAGPSSGPYIHGFTPTDLTALRPAPTPPPSVASSVLFQAADGHPLIWQLNDTNIIGGGATTFDGAAVNPGTSWTAIGMGNFGAADPASPSDILWQNADGQVATWQMNGTNIVDVGLTTVAGVEVNPGTSWKAVGTGQFSDGAESDILLQNADSAVAIWNMNGSAITGSGLATLGGVLATPGTDWSAIGSGNFTDSGPAGGILLQNASTSQVAIWNMGGTGGTTIESSGLATVGGETATPGATWKAIGTGDFNHDGVSDILLQNSATSQVAIWDMGGTDGTNIIGSGVVATTPGLDWKAIGTGGVGDSHILLQNTTSGQTQIWQMGGADGTTILAGGPTSANLGPSVKAIGLTGGGVISV